MLLWALAGRLAIAAWIASRDLWLGAAVAYVAVGAVLVGSEAAMATAQGLVLGAGALTLLRDHPAPWWAPGALVASAVLEIAHAVGQRAGWDPLIDWPNHAPLAVGTFGNARYLGAFVAVVAPLAPRWLLPVFAVGLVLSGSWLATLGALAGLAIRWRAAGPVLALGLPVLAVLAWMRGPEHFYTIGNRVEAWRLGLSALGAAPKRIIFGAGPAGWSGSVPALQHTSATAELFVQAHNEVLQWTYETGLVGTLLLIGWGWHARRVMNPAYHGPLAALAVLSLGLHVFHWAPLAPPLVLVLGLALSPVQAMPRKGEHADHRHHDEHPDPDALAVLVGPHVPFAAPPPALAARPATMAALVV